MSETDTPNLDQGAYELLVAYLDGELDAEEPAGRKRLAEDAVFRSELQQLQFSWDLLDNLPKVEASEKFTQTTVEMVALSAEQDLKHESTQQRRRARLTGMLVSAGAVAAAGDRLSRGIDCRVTTKPPTDRRSAGHRECRSLPSGRKC